MPAAPISPALVSAYTHGDCWVLAQEIRRIAGWQVWVIGQPLPTSQEADPKRWSHMLVRSPEGFLVDVEGISTKERLLARYGQEEGSMLLPVPAGRLRAFTSGQRRFHPDLQAAPTALRVLEGYRRERLAQTLA